MTEDSLNKISDIIVYVLERVEDPGYVRAILSKAEQQLVQIGRLPDSPYIGGENYSNEATF